MPNPSELMRAEEIDRCGCEVITNGSQAGLCIPCGEHQPAPKPATVTIQMTGVTAFTDPRELGDYVAERLADPKNRRLLGLPVVFGTAPPLKIGMVGRETTPGVDGPHVTINAAAALGPVFGYGTTRVTAGAATETQPTSTETEDKVSALVNNLTDDEADLAYFLLHQRGCRFDSAERRVRRMRKS